MKGGLQIFEKSFKTLEELEFMLKIEQLLNKEYHLENNKIKKEKYFKSLINIGNLDLLKKLNKYLSEEEIEELNKLKRKKEKTINIKRCLRKKNCKIREKAYDNLRKIKKENGEIWPLGEFYKKDKGNYKLLDNNLYQSIVEEEEVCVNCKIKMIKKLNNLLNILYKFNNIIYEIEYKNDNIIDIVAKHSWNRKYFEKSNYNGRLLGAMKLKLQKYENLLEDLSLSRKDFTVKVLEELFYADLKNFRITSPNTNLKKNEDDGEGETYFYIKETNLLFIENLIKKINFKTGLNYNSESIIKPFSLTYVIENKKDKKIELPIKELSVIEKANIIHDNKFKIKLLEILNEFNLFTKEEANLNEKLVHNQKTTGKDILHSKQNFNNDFFKARFPEPMLKNKIIKRNYHQSYKLNHKLNFEQESLIEDLIKPKLKKGFELGKETGKKLYKNSPEIIKPLKQTGKYIYKKTPEVIDAVKQTSEYIYSNSPEIIEPSKKIAKNSGKYIISKGKDFVDTSKDLTEKYNKTRFNPNGVLKKHLEIKNSELKIKKLNQLKENNENISEQNQIILNHNLKSNKDNNTLKESENIQQSLLLNLWNIYNFNFFKYFIFYIKASCLLFYNNLNYYLVYLRMCIMRRYALLTLPPSLTFLYNYLKDFYNTFNINLDLLIIYLNNLWNIINSINYYWKVLIVITICWIIITNIKRIYWLIKIPFKLAKRFYNFLFNYHNLADQRQEIEVKNDKIIRNLIMREKEKRNINRLTSPKIIKRSYHTNHKLNFPGTGKKDNLINAMTDHTKNYLVNKWKYRDSQVSFWKKMTSYGVTPSFVITFIKSLGKEKWENLIYNTTRSLLGLGINFGIKKTIQYSVLGIWGFLNFQFPHLSLFSPIIENTLPYLSDWTTQVFVNETSWPSKFKKYILDQNYTLDIPNQKVKLIEGKEIKNFFPDHWFNNLKPSEVLPEIGSNNVTNVDLTNTVLENNNPNPQENMKNGLTTVQKGLIITGLVILVSGIAYVIAIHFGYANPPSFLTTTNADFDGDIDTSTINVWKSGSNKYTVIDIDNNVATEYIKIVEQDPDAINPIYEGPNGEKVHIINREVIHLDSELKAIPVEPVIITSHEDTWKDKFITETNKKFFGFLDYMKSFKDSFWNLFQKENIEIDPTVSTTTAEDLKGFHREVAPKSKFDGWVDSENLSKTDLDVDDFKIKVVDQDNNIIL